MTLMKLFVVFYGVIQSLYFMTHVLEFTASGQTIWAALWGALIVLMIGVTIWSLRMIRSEENS